MSGTTDTWLSPDKIQPYIWCSNINIERRLERYRAKSKRSKKTDKPEYEPEVANAFRARWFSLWMDEKFEVEFVGFPLKHQPGVQEEESETSILRPTPRVEEAEESEED